MKVSLFTWVVFVEILDFHHSFELFFFFSFISVSFSKRKRQKRTKERERVATFSPREKVPKEGLSIHSGTFGHLLTPIFGIPQELPSVCNALCHRGSHTFAVVRGGRAQVLCLAFWGEILCVAVQIRFAGWIEI